MIQACPLFRTFFRSQRRSFFLIAQRHISLNTAINRGIREDTFRNHHSRDRFPRPESRTRARDTNNLLGQRKGRESNLDNGQRKARNDDRFSRGRNAELNIQRDRGIDTTAPWAVDPSLPKDFYGAQEYNEEITRAAERSITRRESQVPGEFSRDERLSEQLQRPSTAPASIPYTTAASGFLYGYSAINAALKAGRRKLYNLYLHTRALKHEGIISLRVRARNAGVQIFEVNDRWLPIMDKVSSGRPHNGFVLEASPLPRPPIYSMGAASLEQGFFAVKVDVQSQSREDLQINGKQSEYRYKTDGWRYPMILYADGILNEGNLGAIIRSAYFLGVDAIATPTRASAPISDITLKAAAGAAEAIPIFSVDNPFEFLTRSSQEGWKIYASDALPPARSANSRDRSSKVIYTFGRSNNRLYDHAPLANHPSILMMGGEGDGLRGSLVAKAHYKVCIPAAREVDEIGVDSLNVSVASSLLCYEFMKKPKLVNQKLGDLLF